MALNDEAVQQLRALHSTIESLKCNKTSKEYFKVLNQNLAVLIPALEKNIQALVDAQAFGETLKQGQLKALQEFTAAVAAISTALQGPNSSGSSSSGSSLSGSGVRPSASGRKPVLPTGVSTLNPDSYFHTKESLVMALNQLHAAFKSSHPAMAKALSLAKNEIEDVGLFDSM